MKEEALSKSFLHLVEIMQTLRQQCPWDKKQTIQSLRSLSIEELYELVDTIDQNDWQGMKEELGDVLLHLLFYSVIGEEQQQFTLVDVMQTLAEKLIVRHPHIYGNVVAEDEETVKRNWEAIKMKEGKKSLLQGVPKSLPAVVKALRIQEKAKQVGFEWENKEQVWQKVEEETQELLQAVESGHKAAMEEELGDVLFSYINYARFIGVDPETALARTNQKFINRFNAMEVLAADQEQQLANLTLQEMDELWNRVKKMRE
ncbi:MAG: nucleoside triphosphate pyrophosphohydrolase [Bacteroidetes bacterium]|nr:MAG: nucleoside triphosphate pyrophosphohydrolase [Bacteroidota bacterium]TAE70720.1 MAG: nucleoside triphosphate pyrophosphohydrolase [Bacteroidota bacterium]TAF95528.1 MAG: nucleoside triphosphate pyrophosphohydrolase [Bacteroidota bacterium]